MKKILFLLVFLSGCMTAPEKTFQTDPDTEVDSVCTSAVEVVPMAMHFDVLPHVENQMPTSPEEAVMQWAKVHLKTNSNSAKKLWIIVHRAEMLKADMPSGSWLKPDEENYTLDYHLEVQVREQEAVVQKVFVSGKGFIQVAKRTSLANKEKGWAWLIQKMLTHLKTKMQTDLKDVFVL